MTGVHIVLDEHVGRVFERVLRERGHDVVQAKDVLGEYTEDAKLLEWCSNNGNVLISNNAKDFTRLHRDCEHAGILLYYDQNLPNKDPEGLAITVDEVFKQYGSEGIRDELVDLGDWYLWLHR